MDGKKKRNKKKKGNQGKNAGDATSSAGEAAPQCQNHESAPHNKKGADADDAMSSVGEGVPQYQNHEPTPQANHKGTNAGETISSVGEVIPCYEYQEPTTKRENCKDNDTIYADQRSIEMSDSSVELDKHRLYEAKLDKLDKTIKQLEDEKNLWVQKAVLSEEKLNNLQIGYDALVKKEEALDNKVRCIEDVNGALTHQETSLKESFSGLEEISKSLQEKVKVLDEASKGTTEEHQRLAKSLDELESRLQALEAKVVLTEASMTKEGNELIADRGQSSYVTVTSENNYIHINNSPTIAYASNHPNETTVHFPETANSNGADQSLIDANAHQGLNQGFDEPRNHSAYASNHPNKTTVHFPETANSISADQGLIDANAHQGLNQGFDEPRKNEGILPVSLDDIQIHEDDPQLAGSDDETAEVPFTDAPIIGAPFRLISFVARYVSGADLVDQK